MNKGIRRGFRGWVRLAIVLSPPAAILAGISVLAFREPKVLWLTREIGLLPMTVALVAALLVSAATFLLLLFLGLFFNRILPWIRAGFADQSRLVIPWKRISRFGVLALAGLALTVFAYSTVRKYVLERIEHKRAIESTRAILVEEIRNLPTRWNQRLAEFVALHPLSDTSDVSELTESAIVMDSTHLSYIQYQQKLWFKFTSRSDTSWISHQIRNEQWRRDELKKLALLLSCEEFTLSLRIAFEKEARRAQKPRLSNDLANTLGLEPVSPVAESLKLFQTLVESDHQRPSARIESIFNYLADQLGLIDK